MPTTAIVIGGSLAGMCAARVLSDFVDAVMIIERDACPSAHDFRPVSAYSVPVPQLSFLLCSYDRNRGEHRPVAAAQGPQIGTTRLVVSLRSQRCNESVTTPDAALLSGNRTL
jgi:hypothetical protein